VGEQALFSQDLAYSIRSSYRRAADVSDEEAVEVV